MKDSLKAININDINGSIATIENIIKNNLFENNLNLLHLEKERALNDYNLYNRICEIVENRLIESKSGNVSINYIALVTFGKLLAEKKKSKEFYRED